MSRRLSSCAWQVETTITELVARNRELTDQIRMYEEQLDESSSQFDQPAAAADNSHRQEQKQRLEVRLEGRVRKPERARESQREPAKGRAIVS